MTEILDVEQIKKLLPHRAPMLLVEKLVDIVPGESATGYKAISINEPFFMGHFPERAVMPGVLIVEAMAQTAGALVVHSLKEQASSAVYCLTIEKARFRKPVVPGDQVRLEVEVLRLRESFVRTAGKAFVDGKLAAEATLSSAMVERS